VLGHMRRSADESDEGFTLIELLVVMIIIGILAAIAIPVFLNQRNSGYDTATRSDIANGALSEEAYITDNGLYTSNGAGTAGSATGALPGWSRSSNTVSVTFVPSTNPDAFRIVGVSRSGKSFCYNNVNSGAGVVVGSTC
jgi:type IV pilus assembly protein PilA